MGSNLTNPLTFGLWLIYAYIYSKVPFIVMGAIAVVRLLKLPPLYDFRKAVSSLELAQDNAKEQAETNAEEPNINRRWRLSLWLCAEETDAVGKFLGRKTGWDAWQWYLHKSMLVIAFLIFFIWFLTTSGGITDLAEHPPAHLTEDLPISLAGANCGLNHVAVGVGALTAWFSTLMLFLLFQTGMLRSAWSAYFVNAELRRTNPAAAEEQAYNKLWVLCLANFLLGFVCSVVKAANGPCRFQLWNACEGGFGVLLPILVVFGW